MGKIKGWKRKRERKKFSGRGFYLSNLPDSKHVNKCNRHCKTYSHVALLSAGKELQKTYLIQLYVLCIIVI